MSEVQDTRHAVAFDDCEQQALAAIAHLGKESGLDEITLIASLTHRLVKRLASTDPDATLALLEVWSQGITIDHRAPDEAELLDRDEVALDARMAVEALRAAARAAMAAGGSA